MRIWLYRGQVLVYLSVLMLLLAHCGSFASAPATPTPDMQVTFVTPTPAAEQPTTGPTSTIPVLQPAHTPTPSAADEAPAPPERLQPTGDIVVDSNLRSQPDIETETVIGQVCNGNRVVLLAQKDDWYYVELIDQPASCSDTMLNVGQQGWLASSVLSIPFATAPLARVNPAAGTFPGYITHGGNMRTAPKIAPETVINQVCPGDQMNMLEVQQVDDTLWHRVQVTALAADCVANRVTSGTEGWVSDFLVAPAIALVEPMPDAEARPSETPAPQIATGTAPIVPVDPNDSAFGLNTHLISRYPDKDSLDIPVDMVAQTSTRWVREDLQWQRIEKRPGEYDWTFPDRTIDLLVQEDINIVVVLTPSVGWATPYPDDGSNKISFYPPDPERFATFATQAVLRYKDRVHHWEIWNEPENPLFWQPEPDAAAYTELLKTTYQAIKAADPDARVLLAGMVPFGLGFLREVAEHGGWDSFDILSLHPFVDPFAPEESQIGSHGVGEVKVLTNQYGDKPIWVTEYGWSSGPGNRNLGIPAGIENQARYLVRAAVLMRMAGAERVFWYSIKDTEQFEGQPFNTYGLIDFGAGMRDYSQPKPAYQAFTTMNEQLRGTTVIGLQEVGERQIAYDFFDTAATWKEVNPANGSLTLSSAHTYSGDRSAALSYYFPSTQGGYTGFLPWSAVTLPGNPSRIGMWVYGDGSGHVLMLQMVDAEGEKLQFRLGVIQAGGWQFLSTPITGLVEPGNQISGPGSGNRQVDFPVSIIALILGDQSYGRNPQGTIYLDALTVIDGPETYLARFGKPGAGDLVVDVIWATQPARLSLPTVSSEALLVDWQGEEQTITVSDGQLVLDIGPSPVYVHHLPASAEATVTAL
ncbi:MAG: hypothetical protein HC837_06425, partial [Chloroflexaceae bacterium]|nr:hypothetical protein [Chloroflexaceae bacterium]